MSEIDSGPFPKGALWGAGLLIGVSILAAVSPRLGISPPPATQADKRADAGVTAVASRRLFFVDQADGGLLARDAASGATVATFPRDSPSGFVRGVVRGLARHRQRNGGGPAEPFALTRWSNGQVSIADPVTGRSIELNAFGKDNKAAFAAMLEPRG